ncbi:MAG: ribose-phosphate pyrophosphokinase [Bacteroidota bacterium]
MPKIKVFSGRSNPDLAKKIAKALNLQLGEITIKNFSDGEIYIKFNENIRGSDVYIVQSTPPNADNLLELLIAIDAAKRASARKVTAVIPYFGYARQDRKDEPRVAITSKLVANLITVAGTDRIITMDLHAPQIQGFFDIPLDHLYSSIILVDHFRKKKIKNLSVVSPDVGGIKMARAYAKRLNAELIVIDKRRPKANEVEILNIIGDVKDKNVLIVDDLIDTAGTFTNAIEALKKQGAKDVYGACTHAVLSGSAVSRIEKSQIKELVITDSIAKKLDSKKITILTAADIFAEAIQRSFDHKSISSLFDVDKD